MQTEALTRRVFLNQAGAGVGMMALASLLNPQLLAGNVPERGQKTEGLPELPHFKPRAKRVIFLYQSGAPSQVDLFDFKPNLLDLHGQPLPESVRMGQRLTTMTSDQAVKAVAASRYGFAKHGKCGAEVSELLPHTAKVVDELCIVRSMFTEAINHDPAITFMQTGSPQPGRPSFGSWVSYGLGTINRDLPTFAVFISGGEAGDQPLNGRLWGAGFLPSQHQGVKFRGGGDPVLYLSNPPGISPSMRRRMVDASAKLNARHFDSQGDPEIQTRMEQFELAFRMQTSVPELTDLSKESAQTLESYGDDVRVPGTYAANCLLARRMVERGVPFVQLYHRGWDHHQNLPSKLPKKCQQVDQASAALVQDLKQRGLLDETLVIWAGEFGRTVYCQGSLDREDYGRDHHPRCFTIWLAGGGTKAGVTVGRTDDFSYNIVDTPVHIHDLQATILHCLGIDHERLTYRHQGRDFRLTDIAGHVVPEILG